ncbi:helix-turn-helix domain-containing protein [Nostoc sp. CCY 9925]|uniref:helix-turn-helix domain-containing protein n=1 Tax=Nostoc sp. CCY 9925 TaxID=3103865 RepID=UPI0039C6D45B
MGARLRIFLTQEQDQTLLNLRKQDVPQKVKDRAEVIRLNAHGWYVEKIAAHFNWNEKTVRKVLSKWKNLGLETGRPHHVNKQSLFSIELKLMSLTLAYCENFRRSLWGLKNNQARNPDFFVGF